MHWVLPWNVHEHVYLNAFNVSKMVSWVLKLNTGFWTIEFLRIRIFGILIPLRIPRVPFVENAFRKFEHVWITYMVIEEVWFWFWFRKFQQLSVDRYAPNGRPIIWISLGSGVVSVSVDRYSNISRPTDRIPVHFCSQVGYRPTDFYSIGRPIFIVSIDR